MQRKANNLNFITFEEQNRPMLSITELLLCRILGRFSISLRFVRIFAYDLPFDRKTLSSIFFSPFHLSFSRNNVCKKTAFFFAYTKKSTTLCFQVLILFCRPLWVCALWLFLFHLVIALDNVAFRVARYSLFKTFTEWGEAKTGRRTKNCAPHYHRVHSM